MVPDPQSFPGIFLLNAREGNDFRNICLFTGGGNYLSGGVSVQDRVSIQGGGFVHGRPCPGGAWTETPLPLATAAVGTHPTGKHSC